MSIPVCLAHQTRVISYHRLISSDLTLPHLIPAGPLQLVENSMSHLPTMNA